MINSPLPLSKADVDCLAAVVEVVEVSGSSPRIRISSRASSRISTSGITGISSSSIGGQYVRR